MSSPWVDFALFTGFFTTASYGNSIVVQTDPRWKPLRCTNYFNPGTSVRYAYGEV
ncbi:hypothetical protein CC86DRAFT_365494 [Ophiobolus disseminans]|uniref:Uncharacterized protein n=1 Tax=Ophiobolus disseminans TaxID=1469910 RepID=A0A6A7AKI3_9PLEO|nr:hypothetical protein CC86DRAFT_365494 [Ophiobolus disseminans]